MFEAITKALTLLQKVFHSILSSEFIDNFLKLLFSNNLDIVRRHQKISRHLLDDDFTLYDREKVLICRCMVLVLFNVYLGIVVSAHPYFFTVIALALFKFIKEYRKLVQSRDSLENTVSEFALFYRAIKKSINKLNELTFYAKNNPKIKG
jgi:hypothetical protein